MQARRLMLFAVGLLLVAPPLMAQQPTIPSVPQTLGLEEALDLAARYNPTYRQVLNDRGPAAWSVRNAFASLFLPSFDASLGFGYQGSGSLNIGTTEFPQPSAVGSNYSLGLSWRLSGTSLAQPGLARAELRAVDAAIAGAGTTLESGIRRQYLAVLQREAEAELAQTQLRRNEEFLRLAQARFEVGQATMLDVRQAEVARGQSEVGLLQGRQAVTVEKLRLFQQMGVPAPEDPSVVTLTDTFPVVDPPWNLSELLDAADQDNPDVNTLRARAASARSSESAAKSEWLPSLSFSAGWAGFTQQSSARPLSFVQGQVDQALAEAQSAANSAVLECEFTNQAWLNPGQTPLDCSSLAFTPADEEAIRREVTSAIESEGDIGGFPLNFRSQPFSARVTVSLPIFTQFGRPSRVARASAVADDAREAVEARRLQVRTDVSQAFYALETAYRTIELQESNRVAAQEQLRLATERYRVGSGTFFELLDAQLAAERAEADYINAVYGYHQSVASLEAAVGRPLR